MKKKKIPNQPKVAELYLTYNENRSGGEAKNPGDRWTSHEDEIIDFQPTGLFTQKCSFQETIDIPYDPTPYVGKTIYVVVVRYYDGGSFGRTCGKWRIVGAFPDQERVQQIVKVVKTAKDYGQVDEGLAPIICSGFYPTWFGYFSGFEGIEVHEFTLSGTNPLSFDDDDEENNFKTPVKWIRH